MSNTSSFAPGCIALLLDSSGPGGIETHVLQLAAALHEQHLQVMVIFLSPQPRHPIIAPLVGRGIRHHCLNREPLALFHFLRTERPSVVHAHGYKASLMSRVFCRALNLRHITTYHAGERCRGKLALYDWLDRHSARLSQVNLAASEHIARRVAGRCQQINNFVDTQAMDISAGFEIAFVGRLSQEKGPDIFLEMARVLIDKNQALPSDFHLYGSGPEEQSLREKNTLGVCFHGHQTMDLHWEKIGILVICSRYEGLPLAALEAMARGIIVVAFAVGQLPSLIEHERNGFLIEAGNNESLSRAVARVVAMSEHEKSALRSAARKRIEEHYSSRALLPRYQIIYQHANPTLRWPKSAEQATRIPVLLVHYGEEWIRGSEQFLLDWCESLENSVYRPIVWTNSKTLAAVLRERGTTTLVSPFYILLGWQKPRFHFLAYWRQLREARKIVLTHAIKLVHLNNAGPSQWMLPAAHALGVPVLTQLHAPYTFRDRLSLFIEEADFLVGVSRAVLKPFAQSRGHAQIRCIYNGMDEQASEINQARNLRTRLGIDQNQYLLVSVGSLIPRKGMDLLIHAVATLHARGVSATLALIGDGPERARLEQLSAHLGMQKQVHFLGEQANAATQLQGADVFVSGARDEAFGLVFIEAGLAKLPCVAPNIGGIPEVIAHGKTGVLYPAGDVEMLARALARVYFSPNLRQRLGEAAYTHCRQHFSRDKNQSALLAVYKSVLQQASQPTWPWPRFVKHAFSALVHYCFSNRSVHQ